MLLLALATWAAAPPGHLRFVPSLFQTADACMSCHNGLTTSSGEDVSIGTLWRASMMANSARDPYWQAAVRREVMDHPGSRAHIEDECSRCHMPMSAEQAHAEGRPSEVFAHLPVGGGSSPDAPLAADGVSYTVCHQIQPDKLGSAESFNGRFVVDRVRTFGQRIVFGPFAVDSGRAAIMHSASEFVPDQGLHLRSSEFCATCHTLFTDALDSAGRTIGRLPEQVPFLEWRHSAYRDSESCQSCHMPIVAESASISGVWGELRPEPALARHDFRGGNFFMLSMLNRFRDDLGVAALSQELDAASRMTVQRLATDAARLSVTAHMDGAAVVASVDVRNLTGHKLPTAYPSRRAWLHVTLRDVRGEVVFTSGAPRSDGSIAGSDNDADQTLVEPHYREITSAGQVQIYEAVMFDQRGRVTTGLLSAVQFGKDNRLLPTGFDKSTAHADISVRGDAADDTDFVGGGDRVRYSIDVGNRPGPFHITAELRFQPIAFRWAENLAGYRAPETDRFVSYYRAMAQGSSTRLAADSAIVSR